MPREYDGVQYDDPNDRLRIHPDTMERMVKAISARLPDTYVNNAAARRALGALATAERRQVRVVFLGSSTTQGLNATSAGRRYVNRLIARMQAAFPCGLDGWEHPVYALSATLNGLPGVAGFNGGVGGTFASNYVGSTPLAQIIAMAPDIVIHMIGSNDYFLGVNPTDYEAAVEAAITSIDTGLTVPPAHILVHSYQRGDVTGTYPWADYGKALLAITVDRPNVTFVDASALFGAALVPTPDTFDILDTDLIHGTDSSHSLLAARIAEAIGVPPAYPLPPTYVRDPFNRVDGALGTAPSGQAWSVVSGAAAIASKKAAFSTAGTALIESAFGDVDVSALVTAGSGSRAGVVFRAVDDANRWYASVDPTGGNVELWATQTGGTVNVATVAAGIAAGGTYHLRAVAVGTAIRVYVNGISKISVSNTLLQTASKVGIRSSPIGGTIANFSARAAV